MALRSMHIFIPTIGRIHNQMTLRNIPQAWLGRTTLVTAPSEVEALVKATGHTKVIGANVKGIGPTRQFICDYSHRNGLYPLMLDDDMTFCVRTGEGVKLGNASMNDTLAMLRWVENQIASGKYGMVGISARQGNNHILEPHRENTRINNAYAMDVGKMRACGARFDRLKVMEDFDVELTMLRAGIANVVTFHWAWNQKGSGAAGGCSTYRTAQVQDQAARELARVHHPFVTVVEKESKSGWDGMKTRTDVRIQWRKAWESANV